MPVYLITLHTYGSWLPDRKQGYVKRGRGIQPQSHEASARYRKRMLNEAVMWGHALQRVVLEAVREKCEVRGWKLYAVATDRTHLHVLVGWESNETWQLVRRGLKSSISRRLNQTVRRRQWLAQGGSRKSVRDQEHFNFLRGTYLPRHPGWRYDRDQGAIAPAQ